MLSEELIIMLYSLPGVGRKTIYQILNESHKIIGDFVDIKELLYKLSFTIHRLKMIDHAALSLAKDNAARVMDVLVDEGIKAIGWYNEEFPKHLRWIPDPPLVLFAKGNIEPQKTRLCFGVVGNRQPTSYARKWANALGAFCGRRNSGVVSGLALGCDAESHRGTIEQEEGYTIAVLASGLDHVFPKSNRGLAHKIQESGGCIVSEYAPGTSPNKSNYIERNRIISGLSDAVVLVESKINGGAMHTARYCMAQHRKLACLLHPNEYKDHPEIQGNKMLLENKKAVPLQSERDLYRLLEWADDYRLDLMHSGNRLCDPIGAINDTKTDKHRQMKLFDI